MGELTFDEFQAGDIGPVVEDTPSQIQREKTTGPMPLGEWLSLDKVDTGLGDIELTEMQEFLGFTPERVTQLRNEGEIDFFENAQRNASSIAGDMFLLGSLSPLAPSRLREEGITRLISSFA